MLEYLLKRRVQHGALHFVRPLSMLVKSTKVLMLHFLCLSQWYGFFSPLPIVLGVCLAARGPSPVSCYHCHGLSSFESQ